MSSDPPSANGSASSATSAQGSSSRRGSSRMTAPTSRIVEPKSSVSKMQSTNIQKTCSGTKVTTQSRISATTITKIPANRASFTGPPGAARIRLASSASKDPSANVQTTRVKVMGAGLRPTGTTKPKCPAVCARKSSQPVLEPFTDEVERGRPVPAGMYYMPLQGAPEQGLGPDERKLRQKLQKYTPTSLSHWKVDNPNDPFAKRPGPLRQEQPDVVSGMFRVGGPNYQQPDYRNPQLEQRLDPSQPLEHWSLSLREAMSLESGVYEQENPDDGQREMFTVETSHIERQVDSKLPGSPPCGTERRSPDDEPICSRLLSPPAQQSPQTVKTPLLSSARPAPDLQNIRHPEFDHVVNVSDVSAPRMQSPMGEIDVHTAIYMQRQVQASHLGTTVDTAVRGTKLLSPGQAKQIDLVKQDRLPPPRPPSPPLQYVMPPRGENRGPPALSAVRGGGRPQDDSMMAQHGSPPMYTTPQRRTSAKYSPQQNNSGPVRIPPSPSKTPPPPSPINLDAAAEVPNNTEEASLDVLRRLVDEERQDVAASQELPPALAKKLNKLKKKPQSMRILEETLDQSVPIDEESDNVKSDILAELMHSQETGVINTASSPRKTYDTLFPPLDDEQAIAVSPAAPAPLSDIVVPVGEADVYAVAVVNDEIAGVAAEANKNNEQIPAGNAFAAAVEKANDISQPLPPRERKSREQKESEGDDAEYIPRGELDEQKAPWDINLGSLEDLVGGKMSMMSAWDNLPSNESVRATAGRLEYVLDVQKPQHHSCVQLRGSQLPAWFPGYYSVLPHVDGCVRLEKSPSRAFASAWHVFAPYQSAEQSEVVYL